MGSKITAYHGTTRVVVGQFRTKGKNNTYGAFFSPKKSYARGFGDIIYKVVLKPENYLILNDRDIAKYPFTNMGKESFDNYLKQGYDSIIWYVSGRIKEICVLDVSIILSKEMVY